MERYNYLVESYEQIQDAISCNELKKELNYLIIMHVSEIMKDEGSKLLQKLKDDFKCAKIAGCSTCHVIYNGKSYANKSIISFILTDNIDVQVECFDYIDISPEELAINVIDKVCRTNTKAMLHFFASDFIEDIQYLAALDSYNNKIKICGGKAGYLKTYDDLAYVFTNDGMREHSLVVVAFSGEELNCYSGTIIGHQPIGHVHTFTETDEMEIKSIDDEDASLWLKEFMGEDYFLECIQKDMFDDILLKFPVVLEEHHGASRFVNYNSKDEKLRLYHDKILKGQKFKIGYLNPMDSAKECLRICQDLKNIPVEIMFCYSCVFRELFLNKVADWELTPFVNANVCGAFMFGELTNIDGYNEALNGSSSLLTLAEKQSYIDIDVKAFHDVKKLDDSCNNSLLMKVIKIQERVSNKQKIEMQSKIIEQEKNANERLFLFPNTSRANINKFIIDNRDNIYDKACYIMIERGEFASYIIGEKNFSLVVEGMINDIELFLNKDVRIGTFAIYMYSAYSFIIVARKELPRNKFMKIVEDLYVKFGIMQYKEYEFTCVSRFVIVLEQLELIDKIQFTLLSSQTTLSRFIVYDSELGIEKKAQDEMHMVSVIHEAIKNDLIIPYFQPLHDNVTNKIAKFEALMRLKDLDGKIYTPNLFMDIAKEYRLYIPLSEAMISKVFDLFKDRNEAVSINLSAHDINSEVITCMIFNRLEEMGSAENFIFEILESENFREFSVLMNFIKNVRKYGVKIAVDDFGSGYSNMMEIARLQPDYIKIDGQIIRGLLDNELNQKVASNISHLANLFDISLVAEYVENENLQNYISKEKIRYSQGYHFSPPVTYDEIDRFL